jgi:hypothetical protein
MIRNRLTRLAVAAFAFGAVACGGSDSTGPGAEPAPQTGTIRLLNQSTATIVAVRFAKCSDPSWGPNRLAESESLAPGALRSWTVEPGCYDLRASTGSKSASWYDRELTAGGALQLAVPAAVSAGRTTR